MAFFERLAFVPVGPADFAAGLPQKDGRRLESLETT